MKLLGRLPSAPILLACLLLPASCATPDSPPMASPPGGQPAHYLATERRAQGRRISLDVEGVDLAEVMADISRRVGCEIVVAEEVREDVSVRLREIPWREAVDVIARMSRCVVEERDGTIQVGYPVCRSIEFSRADLRTVLQLFAAYGDLDLALGPEVKGAVTLSLRGGSLLSWLESLSEVSGLHAERDGRVISIGGRPPRGEVDLDGEPREPPSPLAGPAPRNRLWARGVALDTWLLALASYAGRDLMVACRAGCTVDADLQDVRWLRAALRACVQARASLQREGTLWRVGEDSQARRSPRSPLPLRLDLAGGAWVTSVEALIEVPRDAGGRRSCVVIGDRIYVEGDPLLSAQGEELPVILVELQAHQLRLRVEGRDLALPLPWNE